MQTINKHPQKWINLHNWEITLKECFTYQSITQEPLPDSSSEKLSLPKTEHKINP